MVFLEVIPKLIPRLFTWNLKKGTRSLKENGPNQGPTERQVPCYLMGGEIGFKALTPFGSC